MNEAVGRAVALLLAAGRSERFGTADKLLAPFLERQLAHHAAATLATLPFAHLLAVRSDAEAVDLSSFGFVHIDIERDLALSASLKAGAVAAERAAPDAPLLVALADMPLVPAVHFQALVQRHRGGITATGRDGLAMVPAVFDPVARGKLLSLSGDRGAQGLLREAILVEARREWLLDIDTPDDLRRALQSVRT